MCELITFILFFVLQVKISLAAVGTIKKDLDESQLQEVVTEIVVGALRGIDVHFNLSQYPTCPRLWREPPPQPGFSYPTHYDSVVSYIDIKQLILSIRLNNTQP